MKAITVSLVSLFLGSGTCTERALEGEDTHAIRAEVYRGNAQAEFELDDCRLSSDAKRVVIVLGPSLPLSGRGVPRLQSELDGQFNYRVRELMCQNTKPKLVDAPDNQFTSGLRYDLYTKCHDNEFLFVIVNEDRYCKKVQLYLDGL